MGVEIHDAIIVQSFKLEWTELAHAKAVELGLDATNIVKINLNGFSSFLICTDGSQEGWKESDEGNKKRKAWILWVVDQWENHETYINYVHVRYGTDLSGNGLPYAVVRSTLPFDSEQDPDEDD